jgi:hypothetical protein
MHPGLGARIPKKGHAATGSDLARGCLKVRGVPGIDENELLAEREGLEAVPGCDGFYDYRINSLEDLLNKSGPIFFDWTKEQKGTTYGHASVLIEIKDDGTVIYHDPENAPNSEMSLDQFNSRRQRWKYAMMRRKQSSPTPDASAGSTS